MSKNDDIKQLAAEAAAEITAAKPRMLEFLNASHAVALMLASQFQSSNHPLGYEIDIEAVVAVINENTSTPFPNALIDNIPGALSHHFDRYGLSTCFIWGFAHSLEHAYEMGDGAMKH
jgi:hypothetical protein